MKCGTCGKTFKQMSNWAKEYLVDSPTHKIYRSLEEITLVRMGNKSGKCNHIN